MTPIIADIVPLMSGCAISARYPGTMAWYNPNRTPDTILDTWMTHSRGASATATHVAAANGAEMRKMALGPTSWFRTPPHGPPNTEPTENRATIQEPA